MCPKLFNPSEYVDTDKIDEQKVMHCKSHHLNRNSNSVSISSSSRRSQGTLSYIDRLTVASGAEVTN